MMPNEQVSGADLGPILNRLKNTPRNRPMDAGTFADWSTEAGDTVTMQREGTSFQSQVHSSSMTWRGGSPTVEMNSTGNEKRDPITKISKQKYNRGGVGRRISENTYQWEVNQNHLLYEVDDPNGKFSRLEVTVDGLDHEVNDGNGKFSRLTNTVNGLHHEVYDSDGRVSILENTTNGLWNEVYNPNTGMKTTLETHSGTFSVLCTGEGKLATIKPAAIQAGIDAATGQSKIYLSANHITLDGHVIEDYVTADYIDSKVQTIANVQVKRLTLTNNGYITLPSGDGPVSITGTAASDFIRNLRIQRSNNTYTLEKVTLGNASWQTVGSFSRAITAFNLTAPGSGKIRVTAQPQNQNKDISVSIGGQKNVTSNGDKVYKVYYEDSSGDDVEVAGSSFTVTVNVPSATPSASDIQLYGGGASQITRSTSAPSGTGLSALAQQLVQAYLNTDGKGRYVRFPATITGGTGTKWYYIYM